MLERHTSNHFEKADKAVEKQSDLKVQVEKLSKFQGVSMDQEESEGMQWKIWLISWPAADSKICMP